MTDEEWVDLNASDDDTWYRRLEGDFGLNTRAEELIFASGFAVFESVSP
jgi:hypothetical protein